MRLAVIGVGAMGLPIAARLAGLGHAVTARDVDPAREALAREAGCTAAPTPAAAAAGADAVIVVVVDAPQVEAVLFAADGVVHALSRPACVLLCPTIGPADTERFAARLAAAGIDTIDAPMSGGPARAAAGTMSLMLAAPDAVLERWQPLLEQMASPRFHVGARAGDGARTKLVNNLLAAINLAGAAEALALAERLGLDPARTLEVIEASSGQSWIGSDRLRRALAGDGRVLARVALLAKDSALALAAARDPADAPGATTRPRSGLPSGRPSGLPMGEAAAARFAAAVAAGHGDDDDSLLLALALAGGHRTAVG